MSICFRLITSKKVLLEYLINFAKETINLIISNHVKQT